MLDLSEFERCSGYAGYRSNITEEWIYEIEYNRRLNVFLEEASVVCGRNTWMMNFKTYNELKLYWFKQFEPLFKDVLNMGMTIRQDQLHGYCEKSGNEHLAEWIVEQKQNMK